jgi:hypothetical protein
MTNVGNINYILSYSLLLWSLKNFGLLYDILSFLYYLPSASIPSLSPLMNILWIFQPYQSGPSYFSSILWLIFYSFPRLSLHCLLLGFVIYIVFNRGYYPSWPILNLENKGLPFIWPLSFDLSSLGDMTRR